MSGDSLEGRVRVFIMTISILVSTFNLAYGCICGGYWKRKSYPAIMHHLVLIFSHHVYHQTVLTKL